MKTDTEILDWLERKSTLHTSIQSLYVVDGYEVWLDDDRKAIPGKAVYGESLREAYSKAMEVWK